MVDRRDAATLRPIIREVVLPGTIIQAYSNACSTSKAIPHLPRPQPFLHLTVNNQLHHADPMTDCTTNHVESYWARV